VHNGLVYVSGQLPRNAETGEVEAGAIEEQTELALRNVEKFYWRLAAI
jgi:enamine deaminase RidA (YjgF/YER057c/UK114 family)